jgi:hypothetical protein
MGKRTLIYNELPRSAWFKPKLPIEHVRVRSDFFEKVAFLFVGSGLCHVSRCSSDALGTDPASANNRRTNSFWISIWGPFGELKSVDAVGFSMDYPINHPIV